MKKQKITILLVFFVKTLAFGQIGKGVYTFSPDFSFSNIEIGKGIRTRIAPEFGFFPSRKLLLEGQLSHSFIDFQYVGTKNQYFAGQLKTTYYYLDFKRFKPYVSVSAGANQTRIVDVKPSLFGSSKSSTTNTFSGNIATGVQYFVNKNLAIDANIDFTLIKRDAQKYINSEFKIGLTPFFSPNSFRENSEMTSFLYAGKFAAKGDIHFFILKNIFSAKLNGEYFLTKNINIGSNIYFATSKGVDALATSGSIGYYFHLEKRWYANIDLNTTYSFGRKNRHISLKNGIFSTDASSNIHYFLNKYLSITVGIHYGRVLNSEIFQMYFNNNMYFSTGLKYFIN